jgi:DNA modification methylase
MTSNSLGSITLFTGDAMSLPFPDNSIDLIIAHPPYITLDINRYGGDVSKQLNSKNSKKEMLKNLAKVTKEAYRLLKNNGSFIIANGEFLNLDVRYLLQTIDESDFNYLGRMLQNDYDKPTNTDHQTSERIVTQSITTWYHFVKGDEPFTNPFKVKKYNNPVWDMPFSNMENPVDLWISESYQYVIDAMNQEIPKRFIEMFSKKGHLVLDMFGGTGVTATMAAFLGRDSISNDISEDATKAAELRLMLTFGEKYFNEKVKVVKNEKLKNKKLGVKR